MFISGFTKHVSEPGEKPVRVVLETRPVRYTRTSEEGEPLISSGSEIVREVNARLVEVDAEKAARLAAQARPSTFHLEATAFLAQAHAKKCKKMLDDCSHCQANIKFFATLPLPLLTKVTEERRFRR